jgi:hypothetical protein
VAFGLKPTRQTTLVLNQRGKQQLVWTNKPDSSWSGNNKAATIGLEPTRQAAVLKPTRQAAIGLEPTRQATIALN